MPDTASVQFKMQGTKVYVWEGPGRALHCSNLSCISGSSCEDTVSFWVNK